MTQSAWAPHWHCLTRLTLTRCQPSSSRTKSTETTWNSSLTYQQASISTWVRVSCMRQATTHTLQAFALARWSSISKCRTLSSFRNRKASRWGLAVQSLHQQTASWILEALMMSWCEKMQQVGLIRCVTKLLIRKSGRYRATWRVKELIRSLTWLCHKLRLCKK